MLGYSRWQLFKGLATAVPTAEAYTIIFPELVRLVLPRGVIDIDRNSPPDDVPLIGSTAKVLVRSDLHPEIEGPSDWFTGIVRIDPRKYEE